jgi:UDPglucose 6-dehydrogenase
MKKMLRRPAIFDGRNLYGLDQMQENGFYYVSIGRAVVEN